jgi:type III secretion system low calcium response chaperone LcrH/SycD
MLSEMDALYSVALQEYRSGRYDEAHDLFFQLSVELPMQPEVWKGLAACNQARKYYSEALLSWGIAAHLNEQDPIPHFHAAECLYAEGALDEAKKALRIALSLPCTDDVLDKIIYLKEVIDHG